MPPKKKTSAAPVLDVDPAELCWYAPDAAPFVLSGFPWHRTDRRYRRLPIQPSHPLPAAVDGLANCTAGGQIRFQTDAMRLSLRVTLTAPANMVHMPATGQCGFDLYVGPTGAQRYLSTTKYDIRLVEYEVELMSAPKAGMRNLTINFPLYQGVESVTIGVNREAMVLSPPPLLDRHPVIFYGSSITQGGCACRPGMAYTNILSRRLNRECINLGFSGSGRGEPEVARVIASIPTDPACFVLDYEANAGGANQMGASLPEFIRILRETHREVPILVVSRIAFAGDTFSEENLRQRLRGRDLQRSVVEMLSSHGDRHLHFLDGGGLLGKDFDECTVDGVHPSDLGFLRMADGMEPALRAILEA